MKKTLYIMVAMITATASLSSFSAGASELPTCYYDEECASYVILGESVGEADSGDSGPGTAAGTPDPQ